LFTRIERHGRLTDSDGPEYVKRVRTLATLACLVLLLIGPTLAQTPPRSPDTVYIPTPNEVVAAMLRLAHVGPGDVVYDLGSGDGRIVIAAVKAFGAARGVGVELDAVRVQEAKENARKAGVADRVEFRREDLFETDLRPATVVTLYLSSTINEKLKPKLLAELSPGARVISHVFETPGWTPAERIVVGTRPVFLWTIPQH
jgi:SAM-dependent methyltransferase